MNSQIEQACRALSAFLRRLNIPWQQLVEAERSNAVRLKVEVPTARIREVTQELVDPLLALGPGLSLTVAVGDLQLFELATGARWIFGPEIGDSAELALTIRKPELAAHVGARDARLYFSVEALQRELESWLTQPAELEANIFRDAGSSRNDWEPSQLLRRTTLLVAGSVLRLEGPLLSVVGTATAAAPAPAEPPPHALIRAKEVWALAKDLLRWGPIAPVSGLTPLHVAIDSVQGDEHGIARLLGLHRAYLALLYLAERAEQSGADLVVSMLSERSSACISLSRSTSHVASLDLDAVAALASLAEDSYVSPFAGDRLKLARAGVVQAIRFERPEDALVRLLQRAKDVRAEVDWHWTRFVRDRVDNYLKEERDLEDRLGTTTEAFEARSGEILKSLSDTALATVAAVVGSIIASLFGGKFNADVFRAGMYAYAVYIVLFPCAFGVTHTTLRYRAAREAYGVEEGRVRDVIRPDRVDELVRGRVHRASRRFWWLFGAALLAFVGLASACAFGATRIPILLGLRSTIPPGTP